MVVATSIEALKTIHLFCGLDDRELSLIAERCIQETIPPGQLCQKEGLPASRVNFILKGKVGVEFHLPNVTCGSQDIIMYTLNAGDVFGWSALIHEPPWSSLRTIEFTEVLFIDSDELLELCEYNNHIGFILMRNLASLIATRFRRTRMATLNAMAAIKGE